MPLTSGVSCNSTVWFIRFKPRPFIVARCVGRRPKKLLIKVLNKIEKLDFVFNKVTVINIDKSIE